MYFRIMCSNCGKTRRMSTNRMPGASTVRAGWGSCGSALYCPECTRTWSNRNEKPMSTDLNTCELVNRAANDVLRNANRIY